VTVEPEGPRSEAPPTAEARSVARAIRHDSPAAAQRSEAAVEAARADARGTRVPPAASDGEPGDDVLRYAPSCSYAFGRVREAILPAAAVVAARGRTAAARRRRARTRRHAGQLSPTARCARARAAVAGGRRQDRASAVHASDWHESGLLQAAAGGRRTAQSEMVIANEQLMSRCAAPRCCAIPPAVAALGCAALAARAGGPSGCALVG